MKKAQIEAKIISNRQVGAKYFKMMLSAGVIAKTALPGQFVMVRPQNCNEPFLRRPLGVHAVRGKNIELLYEVVGPATTILSQKKTDEVVDILGPLGNGFDYRPPAAGRQRQILVAGGMGVAPLVYLAEKIKKFKPVVLIGAKTKSHILCEKEFKKLGCDVKIATDDGSAGFKGRVTVLLDAILQAPNFKLPTIFACGPHLMLEALNHVAQKYKIPAQISMEEHMSCGFGACLGCAVNTIDGYKQVCKDGPVFDAQEIIW